MVLATALATALVVGIGACEPSPVDAGPDDALLFLVQEVRPATQMEALYQGRVDVDQEGCFRLSDDPDRHTVVWPFGHTLGRDQASLVFLDGTGREVGRVGHLLRLSGGEVTDLGATGLVSPALVAAATARCPGRFWLTGDVLPAVPR